MMRGIKIGIVFAVMFYIVGCSQSQLELHDRKSHLTWFYDENRIEFNLYIKNNQSEKAEFYLYIVNTKNEWANALNYRIAPIQNGKLFNIEAGQEVLITETIFLPDELLTTEQILSNAFEIIVEEKVSAEKKRQTHYKIQEISTVQD
ncbi:hypothetical protein [Bacillus suaedaesalsae]|uniref:Intracellular proteinase inhibitor BsuPI domain-containing protein n=1 Tax=Bacillus suaedaesalsae TaxID=2810349 RepID=A0ABS2DHP2_9BACI|nr:hypothetical protein [Bacillus suaedaesalsae]MBM6618007.1 hypothetical protein [Bacillus suaedaesalsae]